MTSAHVNRPTDSKVKESDVNRKLQLYGIVSAFQAGKVPSNEQIDIALNSFLASSALANPPKGLSPEGHVLVADLRHVVEQAKVLLLSKNHGNLLQDFIWQSQKVEQGNAALPGAPLDATAAKEHGNQALEGLRTLGTLLISNGQFRKLLNDAVILLRDIAGDAAQKAANKVNPKEDHLAQIDRVADDNTWHDVPDLSAGNIKNQIKSTYNTQKSLSKSDLRDASGNTSESTHPYGSHDPADVPTLVGQDRREDTQPGVNFQSGVHNGSIALRQRAAENVPEGTRDKTREFQGRTRAYLADKLPKQRREQTIFRLKRIVIECQGHPDYQQAITTLLELAESYGGHANAIGKQGAGTVKDVHSDVALNAAETDMKTLIERFANGTSTDDLFESINSVYRDADEDPELKKWFSQVNVYVRKCIKQQGYIMKDAAIDEWNTLYDRGNFLLRDRYRNHTDRIVDEFRFLADQFDQDPQNKRFAESMSKLFTDLGNDENGKPAFKPHLVKDLTDVVLPAIFENIRYVPIPRIEYSDPLVDVVIENLVIESDNLLPNIFEFTSDNYFRWGRKKIANKRKLASSLHVSGIQMDLRDVAFYIKKKKGFPSINDLGIVDIFLGGSGFSFTMKLSTADEKDKQNFFKVDKVDVDVKNFSIKLKQSKHKLLFAVAKPIMLMTIRPALQKAIEKQLHDNTYKLDSILYQIKLEADRTAQDTKNQPEKSANFYQRYFTAAQKQLMQGQNKSQAVAPESKVNLAMTKQDSLFPDIILPGGISSKADEYKELALKGDTWESPVFTLGSAANSSDIPSAPEVARKEHAVTSGGMRDPQNAGNFITDNQRIRDPSTQVGNLNNGAAARFGNQIDQAFSQEGTSTGGQGDRSNRYPTVTTNNGANNTATKDTY